MAGLPRDESFYKNLRSNTLKQYRTADYHNKIAQDNFTAVVFDCLYDLLKKVDGKYDFENRSYNLIDSIGALVIINGTDGGRLYLSNAMENKPVHSKEEVVFSTGEHRGWPKQGIPADTGRGYLNKYFDQLVSEANGTHGFRIYVCAAAYYGQILEDGTYAPNGKKWHVISFAANLLEGMLREVFKVWNSRNGKLGKHTGGVSNFVVRKLGTSYSIG